MNCLKCGSVLSENKCGKCGFDFTSESFVFIHTKKDIKVRLKKYVAMYETQNECTNTSNTQEANDIDDEPVFRDYSFPQLTKEQSQEQTSEGFILHTASENSKDRRASQPSQRNRSILIGVAICVCAIALFALLINAFPGNSKRLSFSNPHLGGYTILYATAFDSDSDGRHDVIYVSKMVTDNSLALTIIPASVEDENDYNVSFYPISDTASFNAPMGIYYSEAEDVYCVGYPMDGWIQQESEPQSYFSFKRLDLEPGTAYSDDSFESRPEGKRYILIQEFPFTTATIHDMDLSSTIDEVRKIIKAE